MVMHGIALQLLMAAIFLLLSRWVGCDDQGQEMLIRRNHRDEPTTSNRPGQGDSSHSTGHVFLGEFYFTPDPSLMDTTATGKPPKKPPAAAKRTSRIPDISTRGSREPATSQTAPQRTESAGPTDSNKSQQETTKKQAEGSAKPVPRKKRKLKKDIHQKTSTTPTLADPLRIDQADDPLDIELPQSRATNNEGSDKKQVQEKDTENGDNLSYIDYTKSMHGLRGKNLGGSFISSSSSTDSETESIIWDTTYAKKPTEIGSEESLEWKRFKSAVKPEGGSTESSAAEDNPNKVKRASTASKRKSEGVNEGPATNNDNLAQRLRNSLVQYINQRPERQLSADNRVNEPSPPIQIGSDLFFSTQPSQDSFYSLVSPGLSLRPPEDRPSTLPTPLSQDDKEAPKIPEVPSKEIIPSVTSIPKIFEKVKIPKNLAHIKDLDEKLLQDPTLRKISTESIADDESDTDADTASTTGLVPKGESFVWSGKFDKGMKENIPSEDGQIREWISFLSTRPKESSDSEEDESTTEAEVEIIPTIVPEIEPHARGVAEGLDPDRVQLHRSHEAPRLSTARDLMVPPHPDLMRSHETAFLIVNPNELSSSEVSSIEPDPSRGTLYFDLSPSTLQGDEDRPLQWTWRPDDVPRSGRAPKLRRSIESPRISTIQDELNAFRSLSQNTQSPDGDTVQPVSEKKSKVSIMDPETADKSTSRNTIDFVQPPMILMRERESRSSFSSQFSRKSRLKSMTSMLKSNLKEGNVFVYMVIPPDGGYGWIVMIMSFLCQVIVDGIIFGIGLLLPDMANDLDVDPQEITLVASMQIGFYFLAGSFNSALINQYGFRPVAAVGTLLSVVAIVLSTFSQNLSQLILLYSVIAGPTLSMIWVSSQLIIGYYFERNRPVANGISCSGAGAGIIIFCMMNSYLVPEIGWRNTSRVHAMILCCVFLLCISYVEVKPTRVGKVKEINPPSDSDDSSSEEYYGKSIRYSVRHSFASVPATNFDDMLEPYYEAPKEKKSLFRRICGECCMGPRSQSPETQMETATARGLVIRTDPIERQDLYYTGPVEYDTVDAQSRHSIDYNDVEIMADRKHSVKQINYKLSVMQSAREPAARRQTYKELKQQASHPLLEYLKPENWAHPKLRAAFRKLFDFRLLTIMEFQVLFASAFLFPMGFNIPFVYSKLRAEIDPFYAFFITPLIGASNFVFRIICGFLAQRHRTWTTYLCGGGIFFGGSAVFVSALYGQDLIWFQYMYAVFYGVAPAFYSTLRAIIYVRSLGLDKLTNAFGMTALAMGCGVFVGTTLAGIMNQQTGSFTASFAFGGICIMTSGALKLMLPTFMRWKEERRSASRRVTFN